MNQNVDASASPKLDLLSVRELEYKLGLERGYLRSLAAHAGAHYDPFVKQEKTRPFQKIVKKKKKRVIDNPDEELSDAQKRIYRRLLRLEPLPDYICGGVTGKSLSNNVLRHLGAPVLVTVDIANFFPSVTNEYVYWLWRRILNCSAEVASLLTRLTSFERHLPQGAATSTPLANILICTIDKRIRAECELRGLTYSTWVDDLAFSGKDPRHIIPTVISVLRAAGLKISRKKIKVMGRATRKLLNGIVLGKKMGVPREVRSRIRSGIHKLATGVVAPEECDGYLRSLLGRIRQAETINPHQIRSLRVKLTNVLKTGRFAKSVRQTALGQLGVS